MPALDTAPTFSDPVVYDAGRDGYVACDDAGRWWRWPAEAHGWDYRITASAHAADCLEELPAALSALALRLSGVSDA